MNVGNEDVWVLFKGEYYFGKMENWSNGEDTVNVRIHAFGVTASIPTENVFAANRHQGSEPESTRDLTSLRYINEPSILHVLEGRSYSDCPYTYLGGILVSVNPLLETEKRNETVAGDTQNTSSPHPYTLAERAFCQMCFGFKNGGTVSQSIVIGGESGSGKTECSKRVVRHLIARTMPQIQSTTPDSTGIDQQLLGVNPILESFGNAATLRNQNSSRFGKFTKLHFEFTSSKPTLAYASISSYLLERSRISSHASGERSFRVFYEFLAGADGSLREKFCLDGNRARFPDYGFQYLTAGGEKGVKFLSETHHQRDRANFEMLMEALKTVGLGGETTLNILSVLAVILHLGNIEFDEEESEQGLVVSLPDLDGSVAIVAQNLGISLASIKQLLCERLVKLPGEEAVRVRRKLSKAVEARDALAKSLYSEIFDWLLSQINKKFSTVQSDVSSSSHADNYVGVLDIFGFEQFQRNDFEQFLINFANEALQETFREQVLIAEARIYREEGLTVSTDSVDTLDTPTMNCLNLLMGNRLDGSKGILHLLQAESEGPTPTDSKFLSGLHSAYNGHAYFPRPHPKDMRSNFIVSHYAADVTYTVGNFIDKNLDGLPKDAQAVVSTSSSLFIQELVNKMSKVAQQSRKNRSIASKFSHQIGSLVDKLNSTQCSFVRCIKPNSAMQREIGRSDWFDRAYVMDQMRCLGIPQTAQALRVGGFPTRLEYRHILGSLQSKVSPEMLTQCSRLVNIGSHKVSKDARFIRALFYAYNIPAYSYRCGLTKIFFGPSSLDKIDKLLENPAVDSDALLIRFRANCVRAAWRFCVTRVIAANRFVQLLKETRYLAQRRLEESRHTAAVCIQSFFRMLYTMNKFHVKLFAVVDIQAFWRMTNAMRCLRTKLEQIQVEEEHKRMHQVQQKLLETTIALHKEEMKSLMLSTAATQVVPATSTEHKSEERQQLPQPTQTQTIVNTPPTRQDSLSSIEEGSFSSTDNTTLSSENEIEVTTDSEGSMQGSTSSWNITRYSIGTKPPPPPPKSETVLKRQSLCASRVSGRRSGNVDQQNWRKSYEQRNRQQRTIFLRLRQEERSYVDALSIINVNYLQPLLAKVPTDESKGTPKVVSKRELDMIFSNLTQLLHLHAQILGIIEAELQRHKVDPEHDIASGFIDAFEPTQPFLRTIYGVYFKQHSISMSTLSEKRNESPKFNKFLRNVCEDKDLPSYGTRLQDLLKIPMNQIERYNEFMHSLLLCALPEDPSHSKLDGSCKIMKQMVLELNLIKKNARLDTRAFEIARQLEGSLKKHFKFLLQNVPTPKSKRHHSLLDFSHKEGKDNNQNFHEEHQHILEPGRAFLFEWAVPLTIASRKSESAPLVATSAPKDRAFFLFSDVLIVAKRVKSQKCDLKMWIDLSKIWVDASHTNASENETLNVSHPELAYPKKPTGISASGSVH
mmetsp:Transcript_32273/g.51489  ORF Transcript_32273/g.51489 Transcript_32273/m.51489 type:complete len:1436 (+) Transcript_32273:626-4933(+)